MKPEDVLGVFGYVLMFLFSPLFVTSKTDVKIADNTV